MTGLNESELRLEICRFGASMFQRGLTAGASGNLSARLAAGFLVTPTNSCLGFLEPSKLTKLDAAGRHLDGPPATKEIGMHLCIYQARPSAKGIVHLHSTYATALSCLEDLDPANALAPLTPYVVMRVGSLALVPYAMPGSNELAELVQTAARGHSAVLMANHGPVVSANSFADAVYAAEELEEAAKLYFITTNHSRRQLTDKQVSELAERFRIPPR